MKRLTTNKDVSEMGMAELAHNSCYAKESNATYRDYESEIDARDFVRKIGEQFEVFEKNCAELIDDDSFDETMLDYLQCGYDTKEGLLALFYRNLWAQADLHNTLKAYEDTGLAPEQMMEIDKLYSEQCKELEKYRALGTAQELQKAIEKHDISVKLTQECKYCSKYEGNCGHHFVDDKGHILFDTPGITCVDRYSKCLFYEETRIIQRKTAGSSGWTLCSERVPDDPEGGIPRSGDELEDAYVKGKIKEYIVMIDGASLPTSLFYVGEGRWYDYNGTQELYRVVAWQPLPEPYKGGDNNEPD